MLPRPVSRYFATFGANGLTSVTDYQQYIHPLGSQGYRLVSPAVTNGGAPWGLAWMDAFLAACTGCQVDAIALHW